jgi:hypothetical protein
MGVANEAAHAAAQEKLEAKLAKKFDLDQSGTVEKVGFGAVFCRR